MYKKARANDPEYRQQLLQPVKPRVAMNFGLFVISSLVLACFSNAMNRSCNESETRMNELNSNFIIKRDALYRTSSFGQFNICALIVDRDHITDDAADQIMNFSDPRCRLDVQFRDEQRGDVGEMTREFFNLAITQIISGGSAYFKYTELGSYVINPATFSLYNMPSCATAAGKFFRYFGRLLGLAVLNKQTLPIVMD